MRMTRNNLFCVLTDVISALDDKTYQLSITEENNKKKGIMPGGYVKEAYRKYDIINPENNNTIINSQELISTQNCYVNYSEAEKKYDSRMLEEEEIKSLLSSKVMEYPELVKLYSLLKVISDNNYEESGSYEVTKDDTLLLVQKIKAFSKKYGHASDAVTIPSIKRVRK